MTEDMLDLARRAVACKGWRWMPGMRYRLHPTHPWFRYDGEDCSDDDGNPITQAPPSLQSKAALPDLTDPATLGCLLALVREAHGQTTLSPVSRGRRLWCLADFGTTALQGESEAELLVAALEAAP